MSISLSTTIEFDEKLKRLARQDAIIARVKTRLETVKGDIPYYDFGFMDDGIFELLDISSETAVKLALKDIDSDVTMTVDQFGRETVISCGIQVVL